MRRMIASMLCALLLLQAVPFAMAQSTPIAMLTPAKAAPGEEFTMTVRLSDWPAMKAMYIAPEYDDTVLILTSGVWLKDGMVTENWSQVYGDAVFAAAQSMDLNGEVFTLTFRVKETAAVKKSVAVTCNFIIRGEQNGQDVTESLRIAAAVDVLCRHGDKREVASQAASCLDSGNYKYYVCDCGDVLKADGVTVTTVQAETIPSLGHNWTEYIEDEAHLRGRADKCTEFDTYWCDCIRCDTINTQAYFYSKNTGDHSFIEQLQDTQHLVPGYTGAEPVVKYYYDCAYCDTMGSQTYDVACKHTDTTAIEGKAPTCLQEGRNSYLMCACGTVLKADGVTVTTEAAEVIPALGHDEIAHAAQVAICTEKGWEAYVTCSRCDYTTYEEIGALGHDEISHAAQAATCTEKGWEAYVTCSRCDYTTYKEFGALGHDEIAHAAQVATCTEKGWEAYVTCSRCDYTTYKETDASGHDWSERLEDAAHLRSEGVDCTQRHTYWYDCANCDAIGSVDFYEGTQRGAHSFTEQVKDEAHRVPGSALAQYYYDCAYCDQMGTETFTDILKGDVDRDADVDVDDAIYLLQHVLMPTMFQVDQTADIDKNGSVNVDDAIYLLQHVLMPDIFPV